MELLGIPGFGRNADMDIDNEQVIQSFVTGAGTLKFQLNFLKMGYCVSDNSRETLVSLLTSFIKLCNL